jgi:hypothetical protein
MSGIQVQNCLSGEPSYCGTQFGRGSKPQWHTRSVFIQTKACKLNGVWSCEAIRMSHGCCKSEQLQRFP